MKTNIFIFHGTAGHPQENWFPWLKHELENVGHTVFVPQFPTPEGQSVENWFKALDQYREHIDQNTILIGHSLGGLFTLRILEELEHPILAAFLIGTPIGIRPIKNYDKDASFTGFSFDWDKIRQNSKHFKVYQSDDDPYVSLGNGQELAKHLAIELTFIPNAGHFNTSAGYTTFEHLKDAIIKICI